MTALGSSNEDASADGLYLRTSPLEHVFDRTGDVTLVLTSDHILQERERIVQDRRLRLGDPWEIDQIPLEQLVPGGDVRIKASSAVLKHNSPVFRLFLRPDSLQARLLKQNGHIEFVDEDVNPEAFSFFMHIFYNDHDDVPGYGSNVRLEFAIWLEAMVIMDKYDLHKSAALYKHAWWALFQAQLPVDLPSIAQRLKEDPNFDVRSWISITYVMRKKQELDLLLSAYKICLAGFVEADFHLPMPEKLHMAEKQRLTAIAAVNSLLVEYFQSAIQWSPEPICGCNRKQDARQCDKEVYEKLARSYKQNGWLTSPKPGRNGTAAQVAVQIDPNKVAFQDLRLRTMRMKNFPHHCEGVKKYETSQKMVEYFAMANQDLYGQLDLDLDHTGSLVESWRQPQVPLTYSAHGFGYTMPSTTLPHLNRPLHARVPRIRAPQMRVRHEPNQQSRQRMLHSFGTPFQASTTSLATAHIQATTPMPPPGLTSTNPPTAASAYASSYPIQHQQLQVSQQARLQAQRSTQMLSAYRDVMQLANAVQSHRHSSSLQLAADRATGNPLWDVGFDDSESGDFHDSAIDLTSDFGFNGDLVHGPGGSGETATSPINVEGYRAKVQEDNTAPVDIVPCNPSPYQTILSKFAYIEAELMRPTPNFKPPERLEID